jgi:glucokinase
MLRAEFGRAEVEHILSGPGLVNLHRFTHGDVPCAEVGDRESPGAPAAISQAALAARCAACVEALSLFVEIFGAEAGNLALRSMATSGLFLGGGMAPKLVRALQDGPFLAAFRAKGAMTALASSIPVRVIMKTDTGLLGAAARAQELAGS